MVPVVVQCILFELDSEERSSACHWNKITLFAPVSAENVLRRRMMMTKRLNMFIWLQGDSEADITMRILS